jgi:hypothetical protein
MKHRWLLILLILTLGSMTGCSTTSDLPAPTPPPSVSSAAAQLAQPSVASPTAPLAQPSATTGVIIVDNAGAGFAIQAGDWGVCRGGDCTGTPYGADFRYADSSCATCRARFDLVAPQAGSYELFVWWPRGADRATDTPFTIQSSGGTNTIKVDQRNNGDAWFWLQTLNVEVGEPVVVTVGETQTGFANADAVALFPTGVSPSAQQPLASPPVTQPTQTALAQPTQPASAKPATFIRIMFLHHSVGQALIQQGEVRQRLTALGYEFYDHGYNGDGLTLANGQPADANFEIPDDNTDPDGLNALFAQPVTTPPTNAFSQLMQYDVLAFKSCFPTSNIESDQQLDEYKTYYRNMRAVMDRYPTKIFIVVTPPPNTPAETNSQNAERARAWANWLQSPEFLSDNASRNIFTFDLFNLLGESDSTAGDHNMLRAGYRGDPNDSHPNELANREIGPQFADFIAQAIKTYTGK